MKKIRILSLLLAAAMIAVTACSGDNDSDPSTTDAKTTDTTENVGTQDMTDVLELPDDLTSDYTSIHILTAAGNLAGPEEFTDELNVLDQALYTRRAAVEERFGIDLEFTPVDPFADAQKMARQSVNSGSDDYQMVFTVAVHQINLVNEGLYLPLSDLPYIDLEKPWWNKVYIESVSLCEDEQYILFGDISYKTLQYTACVFFNINLLEETLKMEPQDLYDIVYDGEWTIDKLAELTNMVYIDDNGNSINDDADIHGMTFSHLNQHNQLNLLAFSSGLDFTGRDEDGYPTLNLNNETTVDLVDKLLALFVDNESVFSSSESAGKFNNGNALFYINQFLCTEWSGFKEMEDDYGILPMPKYDEYIDGYHSTVARLVQWGAVPVTVTDPTYVSAVAEALAYESRVHTTPAYYETTLKLKNTRDDDSIAMIDLIMSGRDTDYLYINPLGGMERIFAQIYDYGENTFASQYASMETAAKTALQSLIDNYENK